jgi:tartrate dehydrogenase/decarboxylase/D-malate dehydrogenase
MGKGIANPMAQILTGAMMLRHLGEATAADQIETATLSILERGDILTKDLGGSSSTESVGTAIVHEL